MPLKLTNPYVVLSEGLADRHFFEKLISKRIPNFRCDFPYPTKEIGGVGALADMLRGVRAATIGFTNVKGIIVVVDSATDPVATFRGVQAQITSATGYPIPGKLGEISPPANGHPAMCVTTLPDEKSPGGLETLCNLALLDRFPNAEACVEQFLQCGPAPPSGWSPEKRDKARYHAYVASCFESDPSRAISYAFKEATPHNPSALLDVASPRFNDIAERLKSTLDAMAKL